MEFQEIYLVSVLGDSTAVSTFYSKLNAAAKDPSNVHIALATPTANDMIVSYVPELSSSRMTLYSHLVQQKGGVVSKGAQRLTFSFSTSLSREPALIVGVVDSAKDTAAAKGVSSTGWLGPTCVALGNIDVLTHETCPFIVVDVATTNEATSLSDDFDHCATPLARPPISISPSDMLDHFARKLNIQCAKNFVGIVSFEEADTIEEEQVDEASPTRDLSSRTVADPAGWLTHAYNALTYPHYLLWDRDLECIRPDFVAHFRRCFHLLDKNRDGFLHSTTELPKAIEIMFGICTAEDLQEVFTTLTDTQNALPEELGEEAVNHPPLIIVTNSADDTKEFKVSEMGFVQYLHTLVSAGPQHVKGVWYLLRAFGHTPSQRGFAHSEEDFVALRNMRMRAAGDILHAVHEINEYDIVVDDDADVGDSPLSEGKRKGGRVFRTSEVLQGQLSSTGVSFFSSLFPSGPRVAHCKPSVFPSLKAMWEVIPPSFTVPWESVPGMPQPAPWLAKWPDLALDKKQGSRSYQSYTQRWRLENLYRFIECWEWAASGAIFIPSSQRGANTWWRQEAVVAFARQWGFRGDATKLFTFRPTREFREGRAMVDGFPKLVHVCLLGASGAGKSSLARLITFDGCDNNDFLADDDEHDIPTTEEDDERTSDDAGENSRDAIVVRSVTIDARQLTQVSGLPPADNGALTSIYFYEIPYAHQVTLFGEWERKIPTDGAALWRLFNNHSVLAGMDLCIAVFDGTNALGFSQLAELWSGTASHPPCKFWTSSKRLPIVPVLTKADELPVGQVLDAHQTINIKKSTTVDTAVADYCSANGLTWPPIVTSAMSEELHQIFNDGDGATPNAADRLNALVVQLAANPSAVVGVRVSKAEKDAEMAIERAAVVTRRIALVGLGVGMIILAGRLLANSRRGRK